MHAHKQMLARFLLCDGTGIVYWNPPQQAMDAVVKSAGDNSLNQYGSGAGLPDLVKALKQKLATENGIEEVNVVAFYAHNAMITHFPSPVHHAMLVGAFCSAIPNRQKLPSSLQCAMLYMTHHWPAMYLSF